MLSVLGPISIEVWPSALAPWVLVPLVIGAAARLARRRGPLSALAVACVGGVNAVGVVRGDAARRPWLLTAARPRRRTDAVVAAFVALATLWWLVPLLLLGRYSPPFLDYIESASAPPFGATASTRCVARRNWVPYLAGDAAPAAGCSPSRR